MPRRTIKRCEPSFKPEKMKLLQRPPHQAIPLADDGIITFEQVFYHPQLGKREWIQSTVKMLVRLRLYGLPNKSEATHR